MDGWMNVTSFSSFTEKSEGEVVTSNHLWISRLDSNIESKSSKLIRWFSFNVNTRFIWGTRLVKGSF